MGGAGIPGRIGMVAAILLAACGVAQAQSGKAAGVVIEGETGRRLDAVVREHRGGAFWGAVLVAKGGKTILAQGYGMADLERTPNGPRTYFDIGSVSKQFTGAAILKLEQQGKLRTEDPIGKFIPDVPADKAGITVHHLVTHTSGLSIDPAWQEGDFAEAARMAASALGAPSVQEPGALFQYSNVGYFLLAMVIERASGKTFEEYLKVNLFAPAGMKDTGFVQDRDLDPDRVSTRVYAPEEGGGRGTALEYGWNWLNKGATGVVTTILDLQRWDQALSGDKVLDKARREKLFRPGEGRYAYGWFVEDSPRGTVWVHHGGATRGYRAHLSRYPDENAMIAVLSNETGEPDDLTAKLEGALFRPADLDARALQACAGTYRLPSGGRFEVVVSGSALEVRAEGPTAACRVYYGVRELPEWPGLYENYAEVAGERTRPLVDGDFDGFRKQGIEPGTPEGAFEPGLAAWQEAAKKHGPRGEFSLIGTHSGREVTTYFRAVFGKEPLTFSVWWSPGRRFTRFVREEAPHPFRVALQPRAATEFAGRCVTGRNVLKLSFDARGKPKAASLTWRDGTAGEDSGVVCKREK